VADGINLRLRRRDMNVFAPSTRTVDVRSSTWRVSIPWRCVRAVAGRR